MDRDWNVMAVHVERQMARRQQQLAQARMHDMVKVQQRGLGKGLSALISENYVNPAPAAPIAVETQGPADAPQAGQREMNIRQIVPGKFQPRTRFTEENLHELAASIRKNGIMQPIIVRPIARDGRTMHEIVAGERRWRAASLAGLDAVPVIVRDITDQQALELAIIENVQRADLTPLEEAGGYQRLLEEFGYTQEELAVVVGKSRSHIANLLRLLALPDDIKTMLDEGQLTMGHARALLNAPNASQLAHAIVDKGLNVRQAEALARPRPPAPSSPMSDISATRRAPRPQSLEQLTQSVDALGRQNGPKDPDIVALEMTLTESLGMTVTINDRGQSGEIVVSYESLAQLDDVLRRLGGGM